MLPVNSKGAPKCQQPSPHEESPVDETAYLHDPQTTIDDLRGDLVLLELQLTMLYKFIDERLGLNREQVLRVITERENGEQDD